MPQRTARRPRSAQQFGMHVAGRIQSALYRLSGGRVGNTTGGMPILLLTTIGRKSGRLRTWPLGYVVDRERVMVVADGLGQHTHPSWYLNLRSTPRVLVQRGGESSEMIAATATDDERARIWPGLVRAYPRYADHQHKARRELPLVVLRPARGADQVSTPEAEG